MAALLAWRKQRSKIAAINAVTREVALDLAEGLYTVDHLVHLPGRLNCWADKLSRLYAPGSGATVPAELVGIPRFTPPLRTDSWWRLYARPSEAIQAVGPLVGGS